MCLLTSNDDNTISNLRHGEERKKKENDSANSYRISLSRDHEVTNVQSSCAELLNTLKPGAQSIRQK